MDKYLEEFGKHRAWEFAYLKGLTQVMHWGIKPLREDMQVVGRAFTVSGPCIYINALEEMQPGSVVVLAHTREGDGYWSSGISKLYGTRRGISGVVIDGGVYDGLQIKKMDLPVFARYTTPRPAHNRLKGKTQVQVTCGGVVVNPGDVIIGDSDGVVVVPLPKQDEVLEGLKIISQGFSDLFKLMRMPTVLPSEDPELRVMFEYKDADAVNGWRKYRDWGEQMRKRCGEPVNIWERKERKR